MGSNLSYSELDLFERIARGDEQAFADIYLRYTEKLLPHVTRLLDSELWAEEIVQNVFTKLWEIRGSLVEVQNPNAFLYRMASNRTLDHLKHRAVEQKMQYRVARQAETFQKNVTQEDIDFRQSEKLFKEALSSLSPQQQLIYKLQREEGLSQEEIAGQLQLSKNTVRNHMAEALSNIRTYFLKHGLGLIIYFLYWIK